MVVSMNDLADEILVSIADYCGTRELLALARSCKRLSRVTPEKLFRHVYYHYAEAENASHREKDSDRSSDVESFCSSDSDSLPVGVSKLLDTHHGWRCGLCSQMCTDGVFNCEDLQLPSTSIIDLSKFSEIISQRQDRRSYVRTVRLDLQSQQGWRTDDLDELEFEEPHNELWRWSLSEKVDEAIQSLKSTLSHLLLSRALFTSECFSGCANPRVIQTMGTSLPFLLILPKYAISRKEQLDHLAHHPQNPRLYDLDCALEYETARIVHTFFPPQIMRINYTPVQDSGILTLYHYTGPAGNLEELLGAPDGLEPYRRWLVGQANGAFPTNSLMTTVLRLMGEHVDFIEERYPQMAISKFGNQVIGDPSSLIPDQSISRTLTQSKSGPLPDIILHRSFNLDTNYN